VLDISFDDDADNSLRGRCYGKTVEQVVRNAGAFNEAMRGQGITSCGKHFPGYSAAPSDAHYQLPRIDRTRGQLDENELAVFRKFIGRGGSPNRPRAIEVNRPYLHRRALSAFRQIRIEEAEHMRSLNRANAFLLL
jgi:beta-glucosidase-like glycosyl hydrolase